MMRRAPLAVPLIGFVLLSLTTGACRHSGATQAPPVPPVSPDRFAVEPGDVIQVQVFSEKDLSGKFQISEKGTIDYPLVGRIKIAGMTPPQVTSLLKKRLADGFLRNPQVAVFVEGYSAKRKIYVWGQVQKSGTFEYSSNMTLIEALTLAGGLSPLADKDGLTLTRLEEGKMKTYALPMDNGQSSNYAIKPGDVIFVPERVF